MSVMGILHNPGCPDTPLMMSSKEIAKLTGKRHDHVMVDIRKMLAELGPDVPDFSGAYKTDRGNTYACYNLPRRETDILLTGYSVTLRAKVIDRWRELEGQVAKPALGCLHVSCTAWASVMKGLAGTQMRSQPHSQLTTRLT
ncbi:Rha family transcriptional regulator [Pseudomonas putida]|uniref:Rha family transcriptional regulator n=1 Tax=Pseudomonas putida TaxID=303 RepID=UPI003905A9E9